MEQLEPRRLFSVTLENGVLTITGTAQSDRIIVYSPAAFDFLLPSLNVKVMRYRAGTTQVVQASRKTFHFDYSTGLQTVIESRGGDDQVEVWPSSRLALAVVNTGAGDDTFVGGATMTRVHLGDGNDMMSLGQNSSVGHYRAFGQGGDDTIIGTARQDVLDGGDGDDYINGNDLSDMIRGGAGNDILQGEGSNAYGWLDWILGGEGDDELYGRLGNDTLEGGAGADALFGGQGMDRVYGLAGDDDLDGGSGNDRLYGNAGNDDIIKTDIGKSLLDESAEDDGSNLLPDDSSQLYP
jgi:Ca2+-binding RTX toxin-like protein